MRRRMQHELSPSPFRQLTASLLLDREVIAAIAVCALYSAAVVRLHMEGGCPAWLGSGATKISSSLASVLGLLLAFRSNASAGRWDASRKAWTEIHGQARVLIRMLSTAPTIKPPPEEFGIDPTPALQKQREVLRLSAAFALAVAIQLFGVRIPYPAELRLDDDSVERVELLALYSLLPHGLYAEDKSGLRQVVPSSNLSSGESLDKLRSGLRRRRARKESSSSSSSSRHKSNNKEFSEEAREKKLLHDADDADFLTAILPRSKTLAPSNVALDILTELQLRLDQMYTVSQQPSTPATPTSAPSSEANGGEEGRKTANITAQLSLAAPLYAHSTGALNTLSARLTELEAIRDTTTPPLLRIHLSHVLVINQLLLPFSLAQTLGWWTPVAAGLIAYVFVALYHLAESLAQPFRRGDLNALPLRRWAAEVVREAKEAEASIS
ncbi:hypothetical protein OC834_003608 [Tilletia horrida]|uniref:Uncharacterized protein n=1 Tax=Tilletia horrida TaxID=155126 RepID=A0AAN6JJM3_9BASI|nr:hypothetical protein OC834_003608 [Tilletia horrida]KAK0530084.1 hypothetical protein OC842_004049 [Tilletia horrida]KAK0536028.1 hypothetical protein OC835_002174 [Tilletia horrida]KAK0560530.1 hypothetical protein OC844_003699 [Tilletia horrida]